MSQTRTKAAIKKDLYDTFQRVISGVKPGLDTEVNLTVAKLVSGKTPSHAEIETAIILSLKLQAECVRFCHQLALEITGKVIALNDFSTEERQGIGRLLVHISVAQTRIWHDIFPRITLDYENLLRSKHKLTLAPNLEDAYLGIDLATKYFFGRQDELEWCEEMKKILDETPRLVRTYAKPTIFHAVKSKKEKGSSNATAATEAAPTTAATATQSEEPKPFRLPTLC